MSMKAIIIIKFIEQSFVKIIGSQLVSSQHFMETEGLLPHHMSPPPVRVLSLMNTVIAPIPHLEDPF